MDYSVINRKVSFYENTEFRECHNNDYNYSLDFLGYDFFSCASF